MAQLPQLVPTRQVGEAVLRGVDRAIVARWEPAVARAEALQGDDVADRVRSVARSFAKELGTLGAAAGGAAAVPGVGTAPGVAVALTELGIFTTRATDLILTIAVVHGIDDATVEERRLWVLAILAFGDGAARGMTKLAGEVGIGLGKRATRAIPAEGLKAINRALGRTIVTKYGTKPALWPSETSCRSVSGP